MSDIHREDIDEALKTAIGTNIKGELGNNLSGGDLVRAEKIRNAYRLKRITKEQARNKIAQMYMKYHEEYDN